MLRGLSAAVLAAAFACAPASAVVLAEGTFDGSNYVIQSPGSGEFVVTFLLDKAIEQVVTVDLTVKTSYNEFVVATGQYVGGNDYFTDTYLNLNPGDTSTEALFHLDSPHSIYRGTDAEQTRTDYYYRFLPNLYVYSYFRSDAHFRIEATRIADAPEPATWAMMIAGFGLVGATLRRRYGLSPLAPR